MTKKKMILNDDWSISDSEFVQKEIERGRESLKQLNHTKSWLLEQLNDIEVSIMEEQDNLKKYGIEE